MEPDRGIDLPHELLTRLDENISCRAVNDNQDVSIDRSGGLLGQLPATADIHRCLARLDSRQLPWVPPLMALVDALFGHLVRTLDAPSSQDGPSARAEAADLVDRLAAFLGSLTEHTVAQTEVLALLRQIQVHLGMPDTASRK